MIHLDAALTALPVPGDRIRGVLRANPSTFSAHVDVEGSPSTERDLTVAKLRRPLLPRQVVHFDYDKALHIDEGTVPEVAQHAFFGVRRGRTARRRALSDGGPRARTRGEQIEVASEVDADAG